MHDLWSRLEPLLAKVQKPARYIGLEDGAQSPQPDPAKVNWLLIYPDTYEIGLPNQGLQILYEILNERSDALAERSYAPWVDLEELLRAHGLPLFSVDTHRPAGDFDILGFNLSAELVFTNVLNCVDLAGVPIHGADRGVDDPLVIAGGHCTYNPEPLADFLDAVVLGDGEEAVGEMSAVIAAWKAAGPRPDSREDLLRSLAQIPGVYVPSLYEVTYDGDDLVSVEPRFPEAPELIEKRTIADLGEWPYPKNQLVPLTEVVHDRLNVEVFRGCTRGCRFCQAGMITRPVRERPAEQVRTMVTEGIRRTGYDEVALTSLSTADYSGVEGVVRDVIDADVNNQQVSVSLPSLRVDAFTVGIATQLQRARRTGLTFAPEAGTWRMRQVINKLIREEDLYEAVDAAFSQGWRRVKLYFLTGLPTETDEDTLGIAELAKNCVAIGKRHTNAASVTVSVGGFVPKPFTPFQWFGQNTAEELRRKINLLRDATRHTRGVQVKWHDSRATVVEGIVSRGDRRLGTVIEDVWRHGGTFQEWSECFDYDLWTSAMENAGLDLDWYVYRHRTEDEVLPWDHISAGLHKDFLWQDWRDALDELGLEDCRWTPCYDCGACTGYSIEHIVASATPPAGGSQGTGQDLASGGAVPVTLLGTKPRSAEPTDAVAAPVGAGLSFGERRMRVRFRFTKLGKVRFTSHRDVARIWERALRRAGLPVASTEGFSPRLKVHFGLAAPTAYESLGEYLDIDFTGPMNVPELPALLTPLLPVGIDVEAAEVVSTRGVSLQQAVTSCTWNIEVPDLTPKEARTAEVQRLLAADELVVTRERKGQPVTDDIRPGILGLEVLPDGTLWAELATQPRGLRPAELLAAFDPPQEEGRVRRIEQWITDGSEPREPLARPVGGAPVSPLAAEPTHAQLRVS